MVFKYEHIFKKFEKGSDCLEGIKSPGIVIKIGLQMIKNTPHFLQ